MHAEPQQDGSGAAATGGGGRGACHAWLLRWGIAAGRVGCGRGGRRGAGRLPRRRGCCAEASQQDGSGAAARDPTPAPSTLVRAPPSSPLPAGAQTGDGLQAAAPALFARQPICDDRLTGNPVAPDPRPVPVGALTSDEVQVIQGALDLASKTAESVMTPLAKVWSAPGLPEGLAGMDGGAAEVGASRAGAPVTVIWSPCIERQVRQLCLLASQRPLPSLCFLHSLDHSLRSTNQPINQPTNQRRSSCCLLTPQ